MKQLNSHGTKDRPAVKEEEVASRPGMLDRVLDEVHDRVTLEFGEAAEAKVS